MRFPAPVRRTLLALATLGLTAAASAQPEIFTLDPAQSRVEFTLAATFHTVHGSFRLKNGSLQFDPATGNAAGKLVVDATTGDTGNQGRDRKMHREILESDKYPEIVFTPQHVAGKLVRDGTSQIELQGVMTLHGQPHPVTLMLPVTVRGDEATAEVNFVVPYIKWGLKNPSTLFLRVSDKATVTVHAVGRLGRETAATVP